MHEDWLQCELNHIGPPKTLRHLHLAQAFKLNTRGTRCGSLSRRNRICRPSRGARPRRRRGQVAPSGPQVQQSRQPRCHRRRDAHRRLARSESLRPALAGCDAVVHVAADYRLWNPDPQQMYRANVDGTRELLALAREAKIRRFVYTSSVATMHFRTDGVVVNEDTPVSLRDMVGHYKRPSSLPSRKPSAQRDTARRSSS